MCDLSHCWTRPQQRKRSTEGNAHWTRRPTWPDPGISTYEEVAKILPTDYKPILPPMERMKALYEIKRYIEDGMAKELNLQLVQVPLIVDKNSGVNDYLDRDGSRTPVEFPCGLGLDKPIEAQVVQAATKWKRMALAQFDCKLGEGINTDMRAVRKDYFLDHDHSSLRRPVGLGEGHHGRGPQPRLPQGHGQEDLEGHQRRRQARPGDVPRAEERQVSRTSPRSSSSSTPRRSSTMYPDLPRKQRETAIIKEYPAVFIIGIGWVLEDGYPHEMRAADYDDWVTETVEKDGKMMHGLNGDILVWNPVTKRRHELTSMGIRVTKETHEGSSWRCRASSTSWSCRTTRRS